MTETVSGAAAFLDRPTLSPNDPYAREAETFPRLTEDQVDRVASFGTVESLSTGTVLFERDDRSVDFFLVLEGHIEICEPGADGRPEVMTVPGRHQFTGELDLFNDRAILVGGRMGVDGRVVRLERPQFRRMLAAEPDVADVIMRAFILRRAGFIQHGQAAVSIIGPRRSADSLRLRAFSLATVTPSSRPTPRPMRAPPRGWARRTSRSRTARSSSMAPTGCSCARPTRSSATAWEYRSPSTRRSPWTSP